MLARGAAVREDEACKDTLASWENGTIDSDRMVDERCILLKQCNII
jgi:hypothetical protein